MFQKSGWKITKTLFRNYSSLDCLDLSRLRRTTLFELKWCKEYFLLFPSSTKQNRYLCCAKVFNDLFFCFARIVMFFKGWFKFNLLKWRWNIFLTVFIKHVFFFLKSCNKIISTPSWHLQNTFVFFYDLVPFEKFFYNTVIFPPSKPTKTAKAD